MTEQARVLTASLLGATIGGIIGCLFLTRRGKQIREQLEPTMDEFAQEMTRFRSALNKTKFAVTEGWRALNDLAEPAHAGDWPKEPRQSSPF